MTELAPACYWCRHFRRHVIGETCSAFPNGIPEELISDQVLHTGSVDGDGGLRFELGDDIPQHLFDEFYGDIPRMQSPDPPTPSREATSGSTEGDSA